ncbi:MAG: LamG-like jellyroll fold domain-containing protein, partial [bacterium]
GLLSYWPRPGEDLNRDEIVAPVLQNTLLAVAGTKERPVLNLHFRGWHVEHVDWPLPAWGYMGLFCCNVSDGGAGHRFIDAAVEYQHARQCSFTGGGIAHAGAMGLCLRKGTAAITVEGNEIQDLGGGGIGMGYPNVAAGYLYAAPPPDPGEYRDYHVANNYVHHCGETYYGAVGIALFASQDSVVAHNLIHDTAYFGIIMAGSQDPKIPFARNNRIEYNHIHHAMKVTVDGAGIYVTFAQADQGGLIRGNVVHDQVVNHFNSRPVGDYSAAGIYLDIANSGCRYEQNVVYRTPSTRFLGGGWRIEATWWRENVFLKTGAPPREFLDAVHARAGLEPAYRRALLKTETEVCDLHDLTPAGSDASGWTASQFNMPKAGKGVVQVFRGMAGEEVAMRLQLRDLDAAATYLIAFFVGPLDRQLKADAHGAPPELSYVDPIMAGPDQGPLSPDGALRLTGRELMDAGLPVKLIKGPHVSWTVYRILSAVVTTDTPRGKAPLPVCFDGTQSSCASCKIVSYEWDFGDGATARESVTAHTYKQRGTYTARLTVKNEQGRSAIDEVTITVKPMDAVAPLFARWKLDEEKGLVAADVSTNKLDGALKGGPVWTTVAGRAGLSFDGVDDIVEVSNRLETLAVPFTFTFWVNPAAEQVQHADILGNHSDGLTGLVMQQEGNKTNLFSFGYGDGRQGYSPGPVQLTAAAWQHVAVVCDGEKAFCYINGEEKGTGSSRGAFAPNPGLTFRLGQGYGSGRFFRGLLSD